VDGFAKSENAQLGRVLVAVEPVGLTILDDCVAGGAASHQTKTPSLNLGDGVMRSIKFDSSNGLCVK
jgi:hypothetical protein